MRTALDVILSVSVAVLLTSILLTHVLGLEQRLPLLVSAAVGTAILVMRRSEARRQKEAEKTGAPL